MHKIRSGSLFGFVAPAILLVMHTGAMAENYKCKSADGRIEYSDRPCDTSKESLSQPRAGAGVVATPAIAPLKRLEALFADYDFRLCERERLASEIEVAQRSGELKTAEARWKLRQERLTFLNDTLIEFQEKAAKITKGALSDSVEMMAVRNFQRKLKTCGVIKK